MAAAVPLVFMIYRNKLKVVKLVPVVRERNKEIENETEEGGGGNERNKAKQGQA